MMVHKLRNKIQPTLLLPDTPFADLPSPIRIPFTSEADRRVGILISVSAVPGGSSMTGTFFGRPVPSSGPGVDAEASYIRSPIFTNKRNVTQPYPTTNTITHTDLLQLGVSIDPNARFVAYRFVDPFPDMLINIVYTGFAGESIAVWAI